MAQISGTSGGFTTIDQHEVSTWGPASASSPATPVETSFAGHPPIITYLKKIRDRRKDN